MQNHFRTYILRGKTNFIITSLFNACVRSINLFFICPFCSYFLFCHNSGFKVINGYDDDDDEKDKINSKYVSFFLVLLNKLFVCTKLEYDVV